MQYQADVLQKRACMRDLQDFFTPEAIGHYHVMLKVVMTLCRSLYITINVILGLKLMMVILLSTLLQLGGSPDALHTLIDEFKCDPNTKGLEGRTPLHYAVRVTLSGIFF